MEITIELLREAGLRLPNPLGQTIGLVGGVVIGQAAVQAHIVSSIMVIIVSVIALASFTVPQYGMGMSFRVLRFVSMFTAATLGFIWDCAVHARSPYPFNTAKKFWYALFFRQTLCSAIKMKTIPSFDCL
ncbi:hypothetical protein BsIDN1_58020 [Bacillus safensis]|uniref:Uncharacterized protein n=1 Tax=Bacillus safensis TaxID=561879 RepID=A0A5S9MJ33_BACIA|nr:hypothetical protein BsIDN1_58020 [Bacillus safensis]